MLITFANSLDPDQAWLNDNQDLDPNCWQFGTLKVFLKAYFEKVKFKKNTQKNRQQKSMQNYPECKEFSHMHLLNQWLIKFFFPCRKPICVYTFFKRLAIEICLCLFLGLDFSQSDASIITDLTTTHWHGNLLLFFIPCLRNMGESFQD